jgi:hypothetical protein
MSPKKSYQDEVRERLLEFWMRREEYGHPIGCATTTYTFDAGFFEEECLARFVGMDTHPQHDDERVYLVEREEKLAEVFACALVDRSHVVQERSLRWHLLPVTVPHGYIMHAKVTLLAWQDHIRVLVGSANLTEYGYRRNFEHIGVLDFRPDGELPLELLDEVVGFFRQLSAFTAQGTEGIEGPRSGLSQFLKNIGSLTESWVRTNWKRGQPSVLFMAQVPGDESLFQRIRQEAWYGPGPSEAFILSPFFDEGEAAKQTVKALEKSMAVQGERQIHFLTPGVELEDGIIELEAPDALRKPWHRRMQHLFYLVEGREKLDKGEETRPLHAKSLWLQREERAVYMIGSSNFTRAGMGVSNGQCNIEANLVYYLPFASDPFARKCETGYPPHRKVEENLHFRQDIDRQTQEGESFVPLPEKFGEALFQPEGAGGILMLYISAGFPSVFCIKGREEEIILDQRKWEDEGKQGSVKISWEKTRPPTGLRVEWQDRQGEWRTSLWVVNVTDTTLLPPPEELRDLELDMLVEILTSARPLHEAVRAVIRRKERAKNLGIEVIFDPHKKVNTHNYLLRRFRRVANALEGLQIRLQRPAYNLEALRWRLYGPVGPLALAERLAKEEGDGAAFMISEVAMVLKSVNWAKINELLGEEAVAREVEDVFARLEKLAKEHPAPTNLAAYVRKSFARG